MEGTPFPIVVSNRSFRHVPTRTIEAAAQLNRSQLQSGGTYDITQGRFRRYAGGRDLPAGKYFSVCHDESGNSGGTLCYELMSYWNCNNELEGRNKTPKLRFAFSRSPSRFALL